MNVGLIYRDQLSSVPYLVDELDNIIASIRASWNVQHLSSDAHGDVTATSLAVAGNISATGALALNGLLTASASAPVVIGDLTGVTGLGGQGIEFNKLWALTYAPSAFGGGSGVAWYDVLNGSITGTGVWGVYRSTGVGTAPAGYSLIPLSTTVALKLGENTTGRRLDSVAVGTAGYFERLRAAAMGEWTAVAYAAGNFDAAGGGGGTWSVDAGDQTVLRFMQIGKTMFVNFVLNTTTVTGTPNVLRIAIPNGAVAAQETLFPSGRVINNGAAAQVGLCEVTAGGSFIRVYSDITTSVNWVASVNNTYVQGCFSFEIQ